MRRKPRDPQPGGAERWGPQGERAKTRLSTREREVLQQILAARCNKEIADELGISLPTAKFHVRAILAKLRVDTREQIITLGLIALARSRRDPKQKPRSARGRIRTPAKTFQKGT